MNDQLLHETPLPSPASFRDRVKSTLIDIFCYVAWVVLIVLFLRIARPLLNMTDTTLYLTYWTLVSIPFLLELITGKSTGKLVYKLQVLDLKGHPAGSTQLALRIVLKYTFVIFWLLGFYGGMPLQVIAWIGAILYGLFAMVNFIEHRLSNHSMISGTRVFAGKGN